MTASQTSLWSDLRSRLHAVTPSAKSKKELAAHLRVTLPAVYQYLSGKSLPSAETTLRLLAWVTAREAQQETPGDVSSTAKGRKTRSLNPRYEKSKRVRKKK